MRRSYLRHTSLFLDRKKGFSYKSCTIVIRWNHQHSLEGGLSVPFFSYPWSCFSDTTTTGEMVVRNGGNIQRTQIYEDRNEWNVDKEYERVYSLQLPQVV
jgi:hypothetical protein